MKPANLIGFAIAALGIMGLGGALANSGERDRQAASRASTQVPQAAAIPTKTAASARPLRRPRTNAW